MVDIKGSTDVELRDPIHGFVRLYPHEKKIIDTYEFQRLRRVRQLGLTHYVYHGAEHSRFGHSIGVMQTAGRAVQNLIERNLDLIKDRLQWSDGNVDSESTRLVWLARLAGLLHDVGHSPFSHTGEKKLFPDGISHEDLSAAIIINSQIGEIIETECKEFGVNSELVAQVVTGTATIPEGFVQELISSPWDVDKMDYLLRDSRYCGVEYGNFDLGRILETLTLDGEEPGGGLRLAIEEGGFHALEEFVLARYFMFTQVYFHDVRRAFDLILTDFISELLSESYADARYPGPNEFDKYLLWDDPYIIAEACKKRDESKRNLAWRIVDRRHPKAVYETNTSPDGGVSRQALYQLPEAARQEFPKLEFWVDQAVDHPDRFRVDDIMIKYPGNPPAWRSFKTESRALRGLEEVAQVRLYSDVRGESAIEKEVTDFCRNFMR